MGRYQMPGVWHPAELVFSIAHSAFEKPVIIIKRDGKAELRQHFLKNIVRVYVEQEDEDIDITRSSISNHAARD